MIKELLRLKRNEPRNAIAVRNDSIGAGTWKTEYDNVLLRLQDDPTELLEMMQSPKIVIKALPKLSDDQREAGNKKVGSKPIGASSKKLGSGGQVRYNYPGEQAKPGSPQQANGKPSDGQFEQKEEAEAELPHPDLPPPNADQSPIVADHPDKPDQNDARAPDQTKATTPKHTLNVAELCAALHIQRSVIQQIVTKMQKQYASNARQKFVSFMSTHLAEFAEEHGLEGDYFGLLFDVMTGKIPEGQPASTPPEAKPAKPSNPGQPVAQ